VAAFQKDAASKSQPGFEASTVAAVAAEQWVRVATDATKVLLLSSL